MKRLPKIALLGSLLTLLAVAPSSSQAPSCTEVQDLLNVMPPSQRTLTLDPGRTYDNSCAQLTVFFDQNIVAPDSGPRSEGSRLGTMILLQNAPGDPMILKGRNLVQGGRYVVKGSAANLAPGAEPSAVTGGVKLGSKARWVGASLEGTHSGLVVNGDHVSIEDSKLLWNFDNLTATQQGVPQGDLNLVHNDLTQASHASLYVPGGVDVGALDSDHNHYGWSPYCWAAGGSRATKAFAMTNLRSRADSFESCGNRWIQFHDRYMSGEFDGPQAGPLNGPKLSGVDSDYGIETGTARPSGPILNAADGNRPSLIIIGAGGDCSNAPFSACPPTLTWKTNP